MLQVTSTNYKILAKAWKKYKQYFNSKNLKLEKPSRL